MDDRETGDPRVMFAAALTRLRRRLPDVSDETLARRASAVVLPSRRRVAVNARRLGEWANGQSVPRKFEAVMVLVQAVERTAGGASAEQPTVAHWQQLWRAARDYRSSAATGQPQPQSQIVIGRPPSDAAALRRRDGLADSIDAAMRDASVRQILFTGAGGVGKSQLASAAFHRAKQRAEILLWVPAGDRLSVLGSYARAWRALSGVRITGGEEEAPLPGTDRGGDDETQADLSRAFAAPAGPGIGPGQERDCGSRSGPVREPVYAVPEGDRASMAAAETAGFRYAVDVELRDQQLSLLVAEPDWVTVTGMDLDHVPGS
ncbi:hypothetical protein [Streptomyces sp. NPDC047043]|uniref:hypothetical protein n=1 Tax=Streptomyces sp. NPDC047043 TaxID=3154497 RepID=UPI00340F26F5